LNPFAWLRNLGRAKQNPVRPSNAWGARQAGEWVDADSALAIAAVWGCVRVISETIAALPWQVIEKIPTRTGTRRERRTDSDQEWLLATQANPELTAYAFRETLLAHALLWGNGYAEIERTPDGRVQWLWPITPDRVTPERAPTGGLQYRVNQGGAEATIIPARDMFHLKGLGWDGTCGYSVIAVAARSLGLTLALERFGANFFRNGAHPGAVLEHPGKLSPEAHENLRKSVADQISGHNSLKPFILEEGMKWQGMTVPPEEAQFLESRKFQVSEVCRWFRVPPHMVADLERSTFSNIEHQAIEFVQHTLMPWCRRLETEADIKLFGAVNRGRVYTRLQLAGLLRGDIQSRYQAYAVGRQWGWLSANDVREMEDLNAVTGGDEYLAPMNMVPQDMLRELAEAPEPAPAAPAEDPEDDQDDDDEDPPLRVVEGGR
jgi:HK97 family phage portal protein